MTDVSVAIVGGGVMGVSLAYHLAKEGWRDVVLFEKNDLTHGSTWHAAGLCTHFAHNPTVQELRAHSVRLYKHALPDETGQSCGFHPSGAMRITRSVERMREFAHVAGLSAFTGYPLDLVDPGRIAELHPLAQLDGIIGGIYEPDDGHVDPTLATQAMAQVARANGVTIRRYSPVTGIEHTTAGWRVSTADDSVTATHVVNAAGTWGWEVGQMMGISVPSVPVLHQYLVTDTVTAVAARIEAGAPELPIIRDPEESWYVRQERDGLILGPYEKDANVWSANGVPPEFGADLLPPDLDRVATIVDQAMARIPALGTCGIKSVINGPITFTPDANPLIGPAHGADNAWLMTGSSMGVMEGGGAGRFLAHWMTHGAPPMDALAVDPRRFGAWAGRGYHIDKAIECFGLQFGVHYPHEERDAARDQRRSPLHDRMLARGAVMGTAYGWERPNWFSAQAGDRTVDSFARSNWFEAVGQEVHAATNAVALADLSVFSKFEVTGPGTHEFLDTLGSNRPPPVGRIGLTHTLTPAGGTLSEFTVSHLEDRHAYLTSAAAAQEIDRDVLTAHAERFDVTVHDATDELAVIGLMGPRAPDVLAEVTSGDALNNFGWLQVRALSVAGVTTRALRVSYIGECGWELHCPRDSATTLYDALLAAGETHGIGHFGAFAANSMRLEKGYRAWGADLTTERTPLECGLDHLVQTEGREFTGRDALLRRGRADDRWDMVLLSVDPSDSGDAAVETHTAIDPTQVDPFYVHSVFRHGNPVGIVTSGAFGHRVGGAMALAYLRDRHARDALEVEVLGERRAARVLERAPFDPDNRRLRV